MAANNLQDELEALRRDLRQVPVMAEDGDAVADSGEAPGDSMRAEIERTLRDLQERLGEAAEDAEDVVAAHPYASVAVAFLLGVLVANLMSRTR